MRDLLTTVPIAAPIQTYGLDPAADWRAVAWQPMPAGTQVTVDYQGQAFGQFRSPLFGPHNVQNVLAAVAVTHHLGAVQHRLRPGWRPFSTHQTAL